MSQFIMIVLSMLVCATTFAKADEMPELPDRALDLLDNLSETIKRYSMTTWRDDRDEVEQYRLTFDEAMDQLNNQVSPELVEQLLPFENRDMRAKLVAIACDRAKRPQLYTAMYKRYFEMPPEMAEMHVYIVTRPINEHVSEEYRLIWEYLLLAPDPERNRYLSQKAVTHALGQIGNPDSIISLMHVYSLTCSPEVSLSSLIADQQHSIIFALGLFCSEESLSALLECISLYDARTQAAEPREEDLDIRDEVLRQLTGQNNTDNRELWQAVLADFPTDDLSPENQALIQNAQVFEPKGE